MESAQTAGNLSNTSLPLYSDSSSSTTPAQQLQQQHIGYDNDHVHVAQPPNSSHSHAQLSPLQQQHSQFQPTTPSATAQRYEAYNDSPSIASRAASMSISTPADPTTSNTARTRSTANMDYNGSEMDVDMDRIPSTSRSTLDRPILAGRLRNIFPPMRSMTLAVAQRGTHP